MSGSLWFKSGLDNTQLKRDVDQAQTHIKGLSEKVQSESSKMDSSFSLAGRTLAAIGGTAAITMLGKQIIDTTAKFEKFGIVLENTLGKVKGAEALDMLSQFAATTPFQLDEVTGAFIKMANQGFVPTREEMVKLGDVASSTGKSFDQLTEAILDAQTGEFERLKEFGIKASQTGDKVTFSFKEQTTTVAKTNSAIRAYILSLGDLKGIQGANAKISESLTGQISNLEDKLAFMYNSIGKANKGLIYDMVGGASTLIDNYESVGKVILTIVEVYGAYKAAIILTNAYDTARIALTTYDIATKELQVVATMKAVLAQSALNKAIMTNPYIAATMAIVALVAVIWTLKDSTTAAEIAQKKFNETKSKFSEIESKAIKDGNDLVDSANNNSLANYKRVESLEALKLKYPQIFEKYDIEKLKLADILQLKKEISEFEHKKSENSYKSEYDKTTAEINALKTKISENVAARKSHGITGYDSFSENAKGLIAEKEAYLKALDKEIQDYRYNDFITEIDNKSDGIIQIEINSRKRLISKLKDGEFGSVSGISQISGSWSKEVLVSQLNSLEAELKQRAEKTTQYSEIVKKAFKDYQDAVKNRDEIVNSPHKASDYTKLLAEANDKVAKLEGVYNDAVKKAGMKALSADSLKTLNEELVKQKRSNLRELEDLEMQRWETDLSTEEEGAQKQLDLAEFNYAKKKLQLKRQQEDYLLNLQEQAQKEWEAKGMKGKAGKVAMPEVAKTYFQGISIADKAEYEKQINEINEARLKTAKDYADKRLEIDKKYSKEAESLESLRTKENSADTDKKLVDNAKLWSEETKTVNEEILKEFGLLDLYSGKGAEFLTEKIKEVMPLFSDISHLTASELEKVKKIIGDIKITPEMEKVLKLLGIAEEDVEKLKKSLNEVKKTGTEAIDAKNWESVLKFAEKLAGSVEKLGSELQKSGGALGEIGSILSGISGSISDISTAFNKTSSKEEVISAGIDGIVNLYSMIATQIEANTKAEEEWNAKIEESVHLLAMARIEAEAYKEANIFGVENPYAKAVSGMKQYVDATKLLSEQTGKLENGQVQTGTKQVVSGGNIATGVGAGAAVGAAVGSFIPIIGTLIGAGIGAIVGGITGALATKTVPVFENLKEKYGSILENGELNPKILADYDKLDDKTKKLVDDWKEIKAKQTEAQKQMEDNFKSLAGDLGQSLSDALVEAFKNGDLYSAIDKFNTKVNEIITNIMQQLIFSAAFSDLFKKLEEDMIASFSEGGDGDITDDILRFNDKYQKRLDLYNEGMTAADNQLKGLGFAGFTGDATRTATAKGFASMSQDSANELNGRFTAMQGHTFRIAEGMDILKANSAQALKHLAGIENNTNRLEAVENGITSMKQGIDRINEKGVKLI
ncbi:MAG: hypothetical protein WCK78_04175 [Paludibacter sp.]